MVNHPPSLTSPPWSGRTKRIVALVTFGLLFLFALQLLQAWTIIIIAVVLSYLLNPLVDFFDNQILYKIPLPNVRRGIAVLLTFVVMFFVITLFFIIIVPPLASQTQAFLDNLPEITRSMEAELEDNLSTPIRIGEQEIIIWNEIEGLFDDQSETPSPANFDIVSAVREAASALSSPVVNIATIAVSFLFNMFFMLVIMFYLMRDGHHFVNRVEDIIPIEYQGDIRRLLYELGHIWNAYLRGQLLLGFIVGVETAIAATILGLPQPLVLALIAGLLEFIPNIGPILSAIPAMLFALFSASSTIPGLEGVLFAFVVGAVYTFIQQSESLFLVPRVMGNSLDLHPVAILIAVLSGAALAGILGVLVAAPVLATMRLALTYVWGKLLDLDPFAKDTPHYPVAAASPMGAQLPATSSPPALSSVTYPEQTGEILDD